MDLAALDLDDDPPVEVALSRLEQHFVAGLDMARTLDQLDALAATCPGSDVDAIVTHLVGTVGFGGDSNDFHDPANNLLSRVLKRRRGQPILLGAVAVAVGRRLGVELVGVGMPGHFLLCTTSGPTRFIDMFNGGQMLDASGCEDLFGRVNGPGATFSERLLRPVSRDEILVRVLTNLARDLGAQGRRRDRHRALELRCSFEAVASVSGAELARVLFQDGRWDEALEVASVSGDDSMIERLAKSVSTRSN